MSDWQHPVRAKLAAGETVLAATLVTSNLESAALIATLGFDFLWVEMEHSPVTLESLRAIVLATRGRPASVFARVPLLNCGRRSVFSIRVSAALFSPLPPAPNTPSALPRHADIRPWVCADREPDSPLRPGRKPVSTMTQRTGT